MLWNSLGSTSVVRNKDDISEHDFVILIILVANEVIATTVKEIGKQFREVSEDELEDSEHKTLNILQAFHVEETKRDVYSKVSCIEHIVESKEY